VPVADEPPVSECIRLRCTCTIGKAEEAVRTGVAVECLL